MTDNPADAVREAHIKALTFLLRSSGSDTLTREEAAALQYAIDRLAALAGAGPDWVTVPLVPTKEMVQAACRDHGYPGGQSSIYAKGYASMIEAAPHAPAKAREVTEADVERALVAFSRERWQAAFDGDMALNRALRAALATFAEGAK